MKGYNSSFIKFKDYFIQEQCFDITVVIKIKV